MGHDDDPCVRAPDVDADGGGDADVDSTASGGTDAGVDANADGDPDSGAGSDGVDAGGEDRPVEVGDGRRKHVRLVTAGGEQVEHGDVFLRHSVSEFAVSESSSFEEGVTTRYRKADLARVEVTQHHPMCFITTAAAGEGPTLDALRGFRDDALAPSPAGRALLAVYDGVSPSVAATLVRHPDARTTRGVRRLVEFCGGLARRRESSDDPAVRTGLTLLLTALYAVGVAFAVAGACGIRLRGRTE